MSDRVTPFLWFNGKAREAARLYTSLVPNSRIVEESDLDPEGLTPGGAFCVTFELDGRTFMAFDGGPEESMKIGPGISMFVTCATQDEVDRIWNALCDGGEPVQCGWINDRFGVTWQVVPAPMLEMLQDEDRARATRVMNAMMQMVKLDLPALRRAYDGESVS